MHRPSAKALLLLAASASPGVSAAPNAGADAHLNCVILPDEEVEASSPVPGVIEEVLVRRSDRVERGQVLARLESSVEEATVALASARAQTDAEIRLRRVELDYDGQHRDRLQTLHARHVVSSQNREDAERAVEAAQLRVRLAQDRRREAALDRRRADAALALKTIRSPIHGVIVQRHKTVGEYVEDQPIVRIARLDPLRVEVIAPLALFGAVHAGMKVAVRPETDPERERVATVTAVDAVADPGSGTFGVQLELPNPGLQLPAGIKCKGRLLPQLASDTDGSASEDAGKTGDLATVNSGEADLPADSMVSPDAEVATPGSVAAVMTGDPDTVNPGEDDSPADSATSPDAEVAAPVPVAVSMPGDPATVDAGEADSPTDSMTSPDAGMAASAPVAAAALTPEAPGTCLVYDALDDEDKARSLAQVAERLGARAEIQVVSTARLSGYIVVTPPEPQRERRRALAKQLRVAGITDFTTVYRGVYAGRISLGVYNGPRSAGERRAELAALAADRRRAALAALGFETEVQPFSRAERRWRLDLGLPPGLEPDVVRAVLTPDAGGAAVESGACEPLMAAAR